MFSQSATLDQMELFDWYIFRGQKGRSLVSQKTRATLRNGDTFGIREVRGGRHHLILPELYRVNFVLEEKEVNAIVAKSNKKKKAPDVTPTRATKTVKTPAGRILIARNLDPKFRSWDSPYFKAARTVKNEVVDGVDFANYQWRKFTGTKLFIKKTQRVHHTIYKNDVFGVRFIKPAIGGMFIDQMGRRFAMSTDIWEEMLNNSQVLPRNRWPEGKLSVDQIKEALNENKDKLREQRRDARSAIRQVERKRKDALAEQAEAKRQEALLKRREERDRAKKAEQELKQSKKSSDLIRGSRPKVKPMTDEEMAEFLVKQAEEKKAKLRKDMPEVEDFEDTDLDADLDAEQSTEGTEELDYDTEEESIAEDATDPVPLLQEIVDQKRKTASQVNLKDLDDEDEEDEELDEDDIEYEEEEDEEGPDEPEVSEEEEDEALAEAEVDDEETAAMDELEEPEEKEAEDYVSEEGDVVTFKSDEEEQREFAILSISPVKGAEKVMSYKVYDTTNEPENIKSVRVDSRTKRTFGSMVTFVRKLEGKEFQELLDITDDYKVDKTPIVS